VALPEDGAEDGRAPLNTNMKILALEFSSPQRSVAVVRQTAGSESREVAEAIETGGRAARPFEMIEAALKQARLEREQIDCLAVGLGPGSYNGIRGAISVAQGWQLAGKTRLLGISSIDCLVEQARAEGLIGLLSVVVDAQRNEFYLASYELDADRARPTELLRLASVDDVRNRQLAGDRIAGPGISRWFKDGVDMFPRAAMLGALALSRQNFAFGEQLEPIYLRETAFVKAPPPRILPA
jgi:tRNA threonylcarbamoyl adenosine modification protein YeaZ